MDKENRKRSEMATFRFTPGTKRLLKWLSRADHRTMAHVIEAYVWREVEGRIAPEDMARLMTVKPDGSYLYDI